MTTGAGKGCTTGTGIGVTGGKTGAAVIAELAVDEVAGASAVTVDPVADAPEVGGATVEPAVDVTGGADVDAEPEGDGAPDAALAPDATVGLEGAPAVVAVGAVAGLEAAGAVAVAAPPVTAGAVEAGALAVAVAAGGAVLAVGAVGAAEPAGVVGIPDALGAVAGEDDAGGGFVEDEEPPATLDVWAGTDSGAPDAPPDGLGETALDAGGSAAPDGTVAPVWPVGALLAMELALPAADDGLAAAASTALVRASLAMDTIWPGSVAWFDDGSRSGCNATAATDTCCVPLVCRVAGDGAGVIEALVEIAGAGRASDVVD